MKKYLLILLPAVSIASTLFIAPWYQTGGARENLFEHKKYTFNAKQNACDCDGSCIYKDSHWAPFGVIIKDCSYDYYYKTFWGKEFYFGGKSMVQEEKSNDKITTTTSIKTEGASTTKDIKIYINGNADEKYGTPEQALEGFIKALETNDPKRVLAQLDEYYALEDWKTDIYEIDLEALAHDFRKYPPERIDDRTGDSAIFLTQHFIDGVKVENLIQISVRNGKWKVFDF